MYLFKSKFTNFRKFDSAKWKCVNCIWVINVVTFELFLNLSRKVLRDEFFHKCWIVSLIFFFQNRFHYNFFSKTIYKFNEMNQEKRFLTEGVLLNGMSSYTYYMSQKFLVEKCFISLHVSQRHFEWCKVEYNEIIYFLYFNNFFLFWKKTINWEKLFFWLKENFSILTLKVWNLFEKMRLTSKIFPHNFKSLKEAGRLKLKM